jgi:hypothetical protein
MGPGLAAHHAASHSASKARVNALLALRSIRGTPGANFGGEKISHPLSVSDFPVRLEYEQPFKPRGPIMTVIAENYPASSPARWIGRILSGLVIVFLMIDGAIKLVPWPIVTETMERMGYGSSDALMRGLGAITIVCTVLYAIPPTSILGAILLTGYLGGAIASHVRIESPLFTHTLFGLYLGLMLWGGLWLRDANLRSLMPFRR